MLSSFHLPDGSASTNVTDRPGPRVARAAAAISKVQLRGAWAARARRQGVLRSKDPPYVRGMQTKTAIVLVLAALAPGCAHRPEERRPAPREYRTEFHGDWNKLG